MTRLSAADRIAQLTDAFEERDARLSGRDPLGFEGYPEALAKAREASGLREGAVWGRAELEGIPFVLCVVDFAFLGGSMGWAVGEKVARAFDTARREGRPILTVTASGGARMQEGMIALTQMAKTVEARRQHAASGAGHLTLLTSPTTGGVYASFAALADVIWAEPKATVGFAGPRVVEELTGSTPPREVHTAEFAFEHGLIDELVPREQQRSRTATALRNLTGFRAPGGARRRDRLRARNRLGSQAGAESSAAAPGAEMRRAEPGATGRHPEPNPWQQLQRARDPARPKAPQIIDALLDDATELRGDRAGGDDRAVVVRIGALADGTRAMVIGQDASGDGRIRPSGFRKSIRALETAGRLGLPVVTLIDTRGADPLPESEGGGVASAIARTFLAMLDCPSPTLTVVTGEGGSGGALAMAPADRLVAWEHSVFSVIAPEGAASILYRDGSRAPELAERLRITAADLVDLGIADEVLPEPDGGAQADPSGAVSTLTGEVHRHLHELTELADRSRLAARRRRWRRMGS